MEQLPLATPFLTSTATGTATPALARPIRKSMDALPALFAVAVRVVSVLLYAAVAAAFAPAVVLTITVVVEFCFGLELLTLALQARVACVGFALGVFKELAEERAAETAFDGDGEGEGALDDGEADAAEVDGDPPASPPPSEVLQPVIRTAAVPRRAIQRASMTNLRLSSMAPVERYSRSSRMHISARAHPKARSWPSRRSLTRSRLASEPPVEATFRRPSRVERLAKFRRRLPAEEVRARWRGHVHALAEDLDWISGGRRLEDRR